MAALGRNHQPEQSMKGHGRDEGSPAIQDRSPFRDRVVGAEADLYFFLTSRTDSYYN
jgi:hypothetical protein